MANHPSAIKRNRQSEKKKLHNKFYAKTVRNAIKKLRETTDKKSADELYPKVVSKIDKLAGKSHIHKNKAANLKSKLAIHISSL